MFLIFNIRDLLIFLRVNFNIKIIEYELNFILGSGMLCFECSMYFVDIFCGYIGERRGGIFMDLERLFLVIFRKEMVMN